MDAGPCPAAKLRRLIYWFWHDLSHFITATGRGQLWWSQGQLEVLGGICVNLARMRHNFSDEEAGDEAYFKLEDAFPSGDVSPLKATFGPLEQGQLLRSARLILQFYKELAPPLSRAHGIRYPAELERLMTQRLEKVATTPLRARKSP